MFQEETAVCQNCATLKTFSSDCIFNDGSSGSEPAAAAGVVTDIVSADLLATSSTDATVSVGGTYAGDLEAAGDSDWIAVNLVAGQTYTISLSGYGDTPVTDTYLRLFSPGSQDRATGSLVASDDDGGAGYYSALTYTATATGTYYIDAASYADAYAGSYIVEVDGYVAPDNTQVWTTQQIADQLTTGYWGGYQRSFNVGADNAITYNLSALDATYAGFARKALQTWSDIIGVQFIETTGSAEITFTENGSMEAWSSSSRSGTTITGSTVNIASNWLTSQGTAYTQQTFIHEIGHALGLGHAGNYNGSASYGSDNLYANDSWQATVMSYFSQTQNTSVDASKAYLLTPMLADIVAIRDLYGTQGTTRTGDTVYGYNNNTGSSTFSSAVFNDSGTNYALTIVDDGGYDTIDMSGSSKNNRIDLTPGSISDTGGLTGNLTIGPDTIIESVIGGSGNDIITGNDADNVLFGNGGADTLNGGRGEDFLDGGTGADQIHGGEGDDTIIYDAADNWAAGAVTGGAGFDTLLFEAVLYAVDLAAYGFEQAALHLVDAASELWSEIYDYYDTGYQLTEQQSFFDDGTSEVTIYDVGNAESWSQWIRTYDADGRLTGETFVADAGGNTDPVAAADQVETEEDTPLTNINVLANDSDDDGDTLSIAGTPTAEHGTVTVNADGTLNYTPDADFNGSDTITYVVSDGNGGTATGTVAVTVTPVNDGPVAGDDAYTTTAGSALTNLDVLANDSDPEGDTLSIDGTPTAANGTVTVNANGTINYTPNAGFVGSDTITYAITDDQGGSAIGTVAITVAPAIGASELEVTNNGVTMAVDFSSYGGSLQDYGDAAISTDGTSISLSGNAWKALDLPVTITENTVLSFDVSIEDAGEIVGIGFDNDDTLSPEFGFQLAGTQRWGVQYFNGQYSASDGYVHYEIAVGQFYTGDFTKLFLAADDDADGSSNPVFRNIAISNNQPSVSTPQALGVVDNGVAVSADIFSYGGVLQDYGRATISEDGTTISLSGNAWKALDLPVTITENTVLSFDVSIEDAGEIVGIGFDNDNTLSPEFGFQLAGTQRWGFQYFNGQYSAGDGYVHYEIAVGQFYTGDFTKLFLAADDDLNGSANPIFRNITISNDPVPVNSDPTTVTDQASTAEDTQLTNIDVLSNDSDTDGDALSIDGTPTADHGTVTVNQDGTLNYTPDADFNGTDTITYTITDGNGGLATGTVAVTVTPVNDGPVANDDAYSTTADTSLTNLDLLANDSDPDGDMLSINGTPTAANGTVTVNADGTINYTPDAGFLGIDQITYAVIDGQGGSATGVAEITVASADEPVDPAQGITIGVLAIDPASFMPRAGRTFTATTDMAGALDDGSITITDTQDVTFVDDNRGETATSSGTVDGISWTGVDTDNEYQWVVENLGTGEQITIFQIDVEGSVAEHYWGATGELVEGALYRVVSSNSNPDASVGVAYEDMMQAPASQSSAAYDDIALPGFNDADAGTSRWSSDLRDDWAEFFSQWHHDHGPASDWMAWS